MILHTGSEGFIGKAVNRLYEEDEIVRLDRKPAKGSATVNFTAADVTNREQLQQLEGMGIETVIHNAAIPDIGFCQSNPGDCYAINFSGTLNMLEFSRRAGVRNFVYVSSGAVYTPFQSENDVITEQSCPDPKGTYSYTKYQSELAVKNYTEAYGFSSSSIRITAPYGPKMTQRDTPAIHTLLFAEKIARKEPIKMEFGGDHTVNYTYVDDVAQMIKLAAAARLKKFEPFNASYGKLYRIRDLGDVCREISPETSVEIGSGTLKDSTSTEEMLKPLRFLQGLRDVSKAVKMLNYKPEFDLKKGMEKMIEEQRLNL